MKFIIIIYGLFLAYMGLSRLIKSNKENVYATSEAPNLEARYKDSWKKVIIFAAFMTEFLNLLFLIPAARLVDHRAVEILSYVLALILILRALIVTFNVLRCPSLDYYSQVETSFYSVKGKKFNRLFDWICVGTTGIIIGALLQS